MSGYILEFKGRGAFAPEGKQGEMTAVQIAQHNAALAATELDEMRRDGRAVLYLTRNECGNYQVTQWTGPVIARVRKVSVSWHNMAGKNGRTDVWFTWEGAWWHGVNIGDNQICRVKRTKAKFY